MASLSKENDRGRVGWRIRFFYMDKRRSIRLGSVSKRAADQIKYHVTELVLADEMKTSPRPETHRWVNELTDKKLRDDLAKLGLCDIRGTSADEEHRRLLGPFLDKYIEGRTDCKKSTITNYRQVRRLLVEYFGVRCQIRSMTAADAERWRLWLLARVVQGKTEDRPEKLMAPATVSKHVKRAKTMFAYAVKDRLLGSSPFAEVKGSSEANKTRHFFVDGPTSTAVLQACPNHDWRLIFALSRYSGLRCPSEVLGLKWSDVLWDSSRLRIDSPKTGLRFCPIFPELRQYLVDAFEDADAGTTYCIQRYRGRVNLGTQLHRIIGAAGKKPWPKTFVNLRSTRRTELQEAFPSHVVDSWLGHSTQTAENHYLQVTEDHYALGADFASKPSKLARSNG